MEDINEFEKLKEDIRVAFATYSRIHDTLMDLAAQIQIDTSELQERNLAITKSFNDALLNSKTVADFAFKKDDLTAELEHMNGYNQIIEERLSEILMAQAEATMQPHLH